MSVDDSLVGQLFKEQREYLRKRGIDQDLTTRLKLEFHQAPTLIEENITVQGVERGILWRIRDFDGVETGAKGARVFYKKSSFVSSESKPKFITPKGQKPRIYFSPLWDPQKLQRDDTIVLCESYLKADVLSMLGYKAIGVSGCWGWSHQKTIIDDFYKIPWADLNLRLIISFDSNVRKEGGKPLLDTSVKRLSAYCERLGIRHFVSYLSPRSDNSDLGIDDYYMENGEESVHSLFNDDHLEVVQTDLGQHLQVLNTEVAIVPSLSKIIELGTGNLFSRDAFVNIVYSHRLIWNEENKPMSVPKAWLNWKNKLVIDEIVYLPGKDRLISGEESGEGQRKLSFNTWKSMGTYPAIDEDWVQLWEGWLQAAFPDPIERHWFCSWWACQLQELGIKLSTALVLLGKSGVGKGWLAQIMKRIFGNDNYAGVDLEQLGSQFNSQFAMKQLIVVEESEMPRGGSHTYNKIKDLVTNDRIMYHKKGVSPFPIDSCANVMLQGNRVDMFKIDEFDRRFAIFDIVNDDIANNEDFWTLRWEALRCGLPETVYGWLLEYDTSDFDPWGKAPDTRAKEAMVDVTRLPRERFVLDTMKNPDEMLCVAGNNVEGSIFTAKELEYIYQNGDVAIDEIEKRDSDNMSKALKMARVPLANGGNKIKDAQNMSQRFFIIRPIKHGSWNEEVRNRGFINTLQTSRKM